MQMNQQTKSWLGVLGQRLDRARRDKGYSIEYVAKMIGMSTENYRLIQHGERMIKLDKLLLVQEVLGISASEFLKDLGPHISGRELPLLSKDSQSLGEMLDQIKEPELVASFTRIARLHLKKSSGSQ